MTHFVACPHACRLVAAATIGGATVAATLTLADTIAELPGDTEAAITRAVEAALASEGNPEADVCVHLADDALLQSLNGAYRGLDRPTDVLSFRLQEENEVLPPGEPATLGDVVISVERAAAQAAEYGHDLRRELCYLAVHGTLHLLGYDDEAPADAQEMARRAEVVLSGLGIGR
jgi:probable rRNA maturation factor